MHAIGFFSTGLLIFLYVGYIIQFYMQNIISTKQADKTLDIGREKK
jgi:hypothetical protein